MPFDPHATYMGGQYLMQGLASLGQGLGGTIQGYQDISDRATQSDALMNYLSQQTDPATGKPVIDPKTLQNYMQHSARERAFAAGGLTAGMTMAQHLQKYAMENRETLARANELTAHAAALTNPPAAAPATINKVWNPVTQRFESVLQSGKTATRLQQPSGAPGSVERDPSGKPVGFYDQNGNYHSYSAQGPDYSALFGTGAPTAAPSTGSTGPQPGDQAYSTEGNPSNLPSIYYQQQPGQQQPQQQGGAGGGSGAASGGTTQVGARRVIQGQLAEWDGTGWRAVTGG
jgi:hypothetical protein